MVRKIRREIVPFKTGKYFDATDQVFNFRSILPRSLDWLLGWAKVGRLLWRGKIKEVCSILWQWIFWRCPSLICQLPAHLFCFFPVLQASPIDHQIPSLIPSGMEITWTIYVMSNCWFWVISYLKLVLVFYHQWGVTRIFIIWLFDVFANAYLEILHFGRTYSTLRIG